MELQRVVVQAYLISGRSRPGLLTHRRAGDSILSAMKASMPEPCGSTRIGEIVPMPVTCPIRQQSGYLMATQGQVTIGAARTWPTRRTIRCVNRHRYQGVRFLARGEVVKLDKNAYWVAELGYRTPQEVLSEYLSRQKAALNNANFLSRY